MNAKNLPPAIVSIDGHKPANIIDACAILLRVKLEQKTVRVEFADGKNSEYEVRAVPLPDAVVQARRRLGLTIEAVTPMLAEQQRLAVEEGMLVLEVAKGSVAARAGLRPGDVVVQLGRYRVRSLDDFGVLLERLPASGRVRIAVVRGGQLAAGFLEFSTD